MKAANFTLPSTNKKNFTLKESLGKYVVLYFYPKDDTPGWTIETIDFNKLYYKKNKYGGGDGIRTHDTVSCIHAFQACAFDRSATPPISL